MTVENTKSEYRNSKQYRITEIRNPKQQYDLEERTLAFAKRVRSYIRRIAKNMPNYEISKQLFRSASSVGANYIEANEALSKKDFIMRIKICRKEAKESIYWLRLIEPDQEEKERKSLLAEGIELMKIFGSIFRKSE